MLALLYIFRIDNYTNEAPKDLPCPPPPYSVGASGSAYIFTENWRRSTGSSQQIVNNGRARAASAAKDDTKFLTLMHAGSIIILVLCALSNIIALHRNSKIMEQNLDLLGMQKLTFRVSSCPNG